MSTTPHTFKQQQQITDKIKNMSAKFVFNTSKKLYGDKLLTLIASELEERTFCNNIFG